MFPTRMATNVRGRFSAKWGGLLGVSVNLWPASTFYY